MDGGFQRVRTTWNGLLRRAGFCKPTVAQLLAASSNLINPDVRVILPEGFPPAVKGQDVKELIRILDRELAKHGTSLNDAGHINVAYPQKDPRLHPHHRNAAAPYVKNLVRDLEDVSAGISWVTADALTELVHLDRSGNQKCDHAMGGRQVYVVNSEAGKEFPLPAQQEKKEFFIVVDDAVEQGTTMANLISFITANGGNVLAAVSSTGSSLQQRPPENIGELRQQAGLRDAFNDPAGNTGLLPQMALAFAKAAKAEGTALTPQQALDMFEERLQRLGRSVTTMTAGEARRAIHTVTVEGEMATTFSQLLQRLDKKAGFCP